MLYLINIHLHLLFELSTFFFQNQFSHLMNLNEEHISRLLSWMTSVLLMIL